MPKTGSDPSFALAVLVAVTASLSFAPALAVAAPFAYVTSWTTPSAVSVIDTANNNIVAIVPSSGRGPIAANAAGTRVYVASEDGSNLSIIDTTTNAVVGKVPLDTYCSVPGVAINPQGTRAYVPFGDNAFCGPNWGISVIDLTTNSVLATLPFRDFLPVGIALNPAGSRMYVPVSTLGFSTDEVWVIDTTTYAVEARIAVPAGVGKLALNAAGTRLYVSGVPWNGVQYSLSVIDTATNVIVATVLPGGVPTDVAVNPDGTRIYVSTYPDSLYIIDAATLAVVATVPVGAFPDAIATKPDGTRVYVASLNSNDVSVVDTATNNVIATIPIAAPIDMIVSAAVTSGTLVEAIEYYYAAWDHYFVTSFPDDIAALDGGAYGGVWKRTGQTFNAWPQPNAAASPTCRFFSTSFAPKSSHFYTPYANECASLKAGAVWQYEGIAFYLQLPDDNGNCAPATIPLYRMYNNGMGGAPNHRYTTSLAILNQMTTAGWVFEGNAATKVFACVSQ